MTKWHGDQMTWWPSDIMTRWKVGEMSFNSKISLSQTFGKMSYMSCQNDAVQMSFWQNETKLLLAKCLVLAKRQFLEIASRSSTNKMAFWQNDRLTKWPGTKMLLPQKLVELNKSVFAEIKIIFCFGLLNVSLQRVLTNVEGCGVTTCSFPDCIPLEL